jgi:hypothetical protein
MPALSCLQSLDTLPVSYTVILWAQRLTVSIGEIGAAYAAGLLTARDAIRVAYYRGLYAKLAQSPNGHKGASK